MSVLAQQHLQAHRVRITRPTLVRQTDGSMVRVGKPDGVAPEPTVLNASVPVHLETLTVQRRESVFGAKSAATETIRVPLAWRLATDDQLEVLDGPRAGERYRIEQTQEHGRRPRLQHMECALVRLPVGVR